MKICLIAEAAGAGVGTHVVQLAEGLLALDHRVDLVYSPLRMDPSFEAGVQRLTKERGFSSHRLPIRRNPHPTDLVVMQRLRARARKNGHFDIVHCHSTKAGLVGRMAMVSSGSGLVYTPHAMLSLNPKMGAIGRWLVGRMEQGLSYLGHAMIAVSMEEKAHAVGLGVPPSKVFVVPNGITLDHKDPPAAGTRARVRAEAGLNESHLCVGFVGRLVPQKAPANLLRAFALLDAETAASARLLMVGDGPMLAGLRQLAAELGIADRVIWLGERSGRAIMPAFDMLLLPSDYEGLPYVVLEAMSHGLPVIATSVGGISLLVKEGCNGHVVPVQRPDLLGSALQSILNDPSRRHTMGEESSRLVKEFSLEKMVSKTMGVYHTVLESRTLATLANNRTIVSGSRSKSGGAL